MNKRFKKICEKLLGTFPESAKKLAFSQNPLVYKGRVSDLNKKLSIVREGIQSKQKTIDALNLKLERCRELLDNKTFRLNAIERHAAEVDRFDTVRHNSNEGMDAFFDNVTVEKSYIDFGLSVVSLLEEKKLSLSNKSVADFGTGPGIALATIVDRYTPSDVVGYDFSGNALEIAKSKIPSGHFFVKDLYEPIEKQFDVALCTEVLEHLEYPAKALNNMIDALNADGCLVVTVPDGRLDRSKYHINFWSPESWEVFIKEACLENVSYELGTFGVKVQNRNLYAIIRVAA